jgi:DNA-binding IclR family transcriptional regulator
VTKPASAEEIIDPRLFVGGLAKGLNLLSTIARAGRPLTISEAAELAGTDRSTAQRMLHTLRALGFLRQEEVSRKYVLGARVLDFAHGFLQADALRRIALPFLDDLARRSEETVNLTELDGSDVVYVARFPSRHVVSVDLAIGTRLPAWCTGPGRAILSCLAAEAVERLVPADPLERRTPRTARRRADVLLKIARAAQDGFAVNDQETFVGDISIAAPIVDRSSNPLGAVNIAVPFPRWTRTRAAKDLAPLIVDTARLISREFGHSASLRSQ